jgi:hypothetical protein
MCGKNEGWPDKANHAKNLAIAVLVFGVLSCVGISAGEWLGGVGGILSVVASSMIICCAPPQAGPGKVSASCHVERVTLTSFYRADDRATFSPVLRLPR